MQVERSVLACDLATQATRSGNTPFGSVMLQIDDETGEVIRDWQGINRAGEWKDPIAHAEMIVIRAACKDLGVVSLVGIEREVSKMPQVARPCTASCTQAMSLARCVIARVAMPIFPSCIFLHRIRWHRGWAFISRG